METLKYTVIRDDRQYDEYCRILHELDFATRKTKRVEDEIELLTLLIETYDKEKRTLEWPDPVALLKSLMAEHGMKSVQLARLLNVSTGLVSDILNYKKGISKEVIRKLAGEFKVSQEAFNRKYRLKTTTVRSIKKAALKKRKKELATL